MDLLQRIDEVLPVAKAITPGPWKLEYPECSGDPASCPENEGRGCCQPNPSRTSIQPRESDMGPRTTEPHE